MDKLAQLVSERRGLKESLRYCEEQIITELTRGGHTFFFRIDWSKLENEFAKGVKNGS